MTTGDLNLEDALSDILEKMFAEIEVFNLAVANPHYYRMYRQLALGSALHYLYRDLVEQAPAAFTETVFNPTAAAAWQATRNPTIHDFIGSPDCSVRCDPDTGRAEFRHRTLNDGTQLGHIGDLAACTMTGALLQNPLISAPESLVITLSLLHHLAQDPDTHDIDGVLWFPNGHTTTPEMATP